MLVNIKRNSQKDNAFIVRSKVIRDGFGLNKSDFNLGREYAMTFNVNNEHVTLKGRSARSSGNIVRIGVKNIPEHLHDAFMNFNTVTVDLEDVKKIETK